MNLKKYQGLLMIQARKNNRRQEKHQGQVMEKGLPQRQEKKLKDRTA